MALIHSTRVTAIAAAVAVMLGGAAIALATHAAAPTATDLPGIASSRLPTAAAEAGGVPVGDHAVTPVPDLVPSLASTDTPTGTNSGTPASKPAVDLPAIPAAPGSQTDVIEQDDDDHELVTPPVREDDDPDEDDVDDAASDTEEHRSDEESSTYSGEPEDDE